MLFFHRRKGKDRRSNKGRGELDNPQYKGSEKRSEIERRRDKNRRSGVDRRSGLYHKLSDQRKTTLDGILNKLEDLIDEER